ncbi:MAG: hypothetical protein HYW01_00630 [Deltaproteobacteria bacterium]|nr:hypothetical protein [Deltaproteobacteria bacterium]
MEIKRALQIARREWRNIRVSLERSGDVGGFDSKSHVNNRLALVMIETGDKYPTYEHINQGSLLIKNLIEMENKLPKHGYITQEAGYVFNALGSVAAEKLGLKGIQAQSFGSGYSWVRTGWFYPIGVEKQNVVQQLFFFKLFFPLVVYFNWDFKSPIVKKKLDLVFYKFNKWQNDPAIYFRDVRDYREQLEPLWRGLSLDLGFSPFDSDKEYQNLEDVVNWF